jgi:glycosyltransferase involved in cell wall biosynthesis
VWVVMPAYNESHYIGRVLSKLRKVTPYFLVVDDGSRDQTASIAKRYSQHVLVHPVNLGKGAAMLTGCEYAFKKLNASAVILMDSDDQHDPKIIPHFIDKLNQGAQVVFGVRSLVTLPGMRRVGNLFASLFVWLLFGKYYPDIPSGYKALTKQAYKHLKWNSSGYHVEMEITTRAAKANLSEAQVEIPTIYHNYDKGMTLLDTLDMFFHLLSWRWRI